MPASKLPTIVMTWTCLGIVLGNMIGFFAYQSMTPRFESKAVVELSENGTTLATEQESKSGLDSFFLSTELIGKALKDVRPISPTGRLAKTANSEEAIRAWIQSPDYRVSRATDRDGANLYQISYVSTLPSQSKQVITAILDAAESLVPNPASPEKEVESIESLLSLTNESERRIQKLRHQLLEIPSNPDARWSESGVVSANTLEWSRLQRLAEKLHLRKDALQVKLISLLASQNPSDGLSQTASADTQHVPSASNNRVQANPQTERFDNEKRISYLKKEIRLIFQEHVKISESLRVLAAKIDLEEQLAFEEYSLRKQLDQELIIRDRIVAELKVPLSKGSSPNVQLRIISEASEPIQIAPVLSRCLILGAVLGGLSFGVLSLIVIMGTVDDSRPETAGNA